MLCRSIVFPLDVAYLLASMAFFSLSFAASPKIAVSQFFLGMYRIFGVSLQQMRHHRACNARGNGHFQFVGDSLVLRAASDSLLTADNEKVDKPPMYSRPCTRIFDPRTFGFNACARTTCRAQQFISSISTICTESQIVHFSRCIHFVRFVFSSCKCDFFHQSDQSFRFV